MPAIDATLIADLVRAGLDPELVGRVANAIVAASAGPSGGIPVDTAAERRRAWDRERKAQKRNSTGISTGIPPDAGSALSISSKDLEIKKEPKKERARGNRIPPDWQPNAGHVAAGLKLGYSEKQITEQAEDMRLWGHSNHHRAVARKSDWDLTFLGWLRRNKPKGHVNGHGNPTMDACDRLLARAEDRDRERGDSARDITPGGD